MCCTTVTSYYNYAFYQIIAIWIGFTGSTDILQVFPSELTQRIHERCNFTWDDSVLRNATLVFDSQENLQIIVRLACITW